MTVAILYRDELKEYDFEPGHLFAAIDMKDSPHF